MHSASSLSVAMSMRMGSSHVWDYGNESPEEYLSDSELEGSSSDEDTSEKEASPHDGRGKRNSKEMLLKQLMRYVYSSCSVVS